MTGRCVSSGWTPAWIAVERWWYVCLSNLGFEMFFLNLCMYTLLIRLYTDAIFNVAIYSLWVFPQLFYITVRFSNFWRPNISSSILIWALWVTCGLSSSFVGYSLVTDGPFDGLKFVNICKLVTIAFPQAMRNHMAGNFVFVFSRVVF